MRQLASILTFTVLVVASYSPLASAAPTCSSLGYELEGEAVGKYRAKNNEIRTALELSPLRERWGIHDTIYSTLLVRTKSSNWPSIKKMQLHIRADNKELSSHVIEPPHVTIGKDIRARFKSSSLQPLAEAMSGKNGKAIELSLRIGEETVCIHKMTYQGGH